MYIYHIAIALSVFFAFLAFFVTENNARYILAGYNTMSDQERMTFDIIRFIAYWRRFHLWLAVSFLLIISVLHYLFGDSVSGFFLALYPLGAYVVFLNGSRRYQSKESSRVAARIGVWILLLFQLILAGYMFYGMRSAAVKLYDDGLLVTGAFGPYIEFREITEVDLLTDVPVMHKKLSGYDVLGLRRGKFKALDGETLVLITDSRSPAVLRIERANKKPLLLSSSRIDEELLYDMLCKKLKP
jgi:hypothetical protein